MFTVKRTIKLDMLITVEALYRSWINSVSSFTYFHRGRANYLPRDSSSIAPSSSIGGHSIIHRSSVPSFVCFRVDCRRVVNDERLPVALQGVSLKKRPDPFNRRLCRGPLRFPFPPPRRRRFQRFVPAARIFRERKKEKGC